MKLYSKPELNVEKFDVEDVLTANGSTVNDKEFVEMSADISAGMEFDITAEGNEF